jgi:hypothetical protein
VRTFDEGGRRSAKSKTKRAPKLADRHLGPPKAPPLHSPRGPAATNPARRLLASSVAWLTGPAAAAGSVLRETERDAELRATDPGFRFADSPRARLFSWRPALGAPDIGLLGAAGGVEAEFQSEAPDRAPASGARERDTEARGPGEPGADARHDRASDGERHADEVREDGDDTSAREGSERHAEAVTALALRGQRPRSVTSIKVTDIGRLEASLREVDTLGDDQGQGRPPLAQKQPSDGAKRPASGAHAELRPPQGDPRDPASGDGARIAPEDRAAIAKAQAQSAALDAQPALPVLPPPKRDAGSAGKEAPALAAPAVAMAEPPPKIALGPRAAGEGKDSERPPNGEVKAKAGADTKTDDPGSTDMAVETVVEPAGGGGGGSVAAWKGRVAGSTDKVKEKPIPDSDIYVTSIKAAAADPNAVRAAKLKSLEEEGKKAITPAKDPPENKAAIPDDPTHRASKLVDDLCGDNRKVELSPSESTLPDLQETPYHHIPVIGSRLGRDPEDFEFVELPPVEGEKGAKPERIYRQGGIPPVDEKKKQAWDERQKKIAKTPASTKRALGKGVTVKHENAPPPLVVPEFAKVDVGDVLARLLAEPDEYAKKAFDQARKSYHSGVLDEVPNHVGEGLAKQEAPAFAAELQRVADAAGVKKEDLDKKVDDRRKFLIEKKGQNEQSLSKAHEQAKTDIQSSGKGFLDTIATVRARIDDEGERRAAAAKGNVDLEALRKRRDAMYNALDDKVGKWVVIFKADGKRFKDGLDTAKGQQIQAYGVAAKQDQWFLEKDAGGDEAKLVAARKIYDETTKVWLQQRVKDIDKVINPAKLSIDKKVETYQGDLRDAGTNARGIVRTWYDQSIGYERSWWSQLLDRIFTWLEQSKKESAAWETARATETNEALKQDMVMLAKVRLTAGEELDEASIESNKSLNEEQKAVLKAYYGKDGKDPVQALAAGLATRIRLQRQPEIVKAIEQEVNALNSPNDLPLLVAIGDKQTTGFKGKYFLLADEIRVAVRGWGTDEQGVFKALAGLTPIQAKCIEIDYQMRYHENMRERLKDELDDTFSTSHDWDKAQALLAGDKATVAAVELNDAMEGAFLGTGWGTDEDKIFQVLRGKSAEEIEAIKKAYKAKYGKDLNAQLKDELGSGPGQTAHDVEEASLLMEGKAEEAMAVEMDRAMRGTFLGTGWGTDRKAMEGVYERIKHEVEAEGQRSGWSAAMIRDEIARRNAGLDAAYEKKYGKDWTDRRAGESALRAAFRDEMQGADLNLIVGMADQDWKKVDAARIQLEHQSVFYADDKVIRDSMSAQYRRDIADAKIDGYLDVDRRIAVQKELDWARVRSVPPPISEEEKKKGILSETDFLDKWRADATAERRKKDRKGVDQRAEAIAREKAPDNMLALAKEFDASYANYDPHTGMKMSFTDVVRADTSGSDSDAVDRMLEWRTVDGKLTMGFLTADEEIQYAVQGTGTDEDKLKDVLKGKSQEEILQIANAWAAKHPPEPGDTRTPYQRFRARISEELSGRDEFDIMEVVDYGDAQTPEEHAAKAKRRYDFESRSSNWFATEQLDSLQKSSRILDADVAALRAFEARRPKPGDKDYTPEKLREWDDKWEQKNAAVEAQIENVDRAVENHRHSVDEITDTIVTIVTIVVLVVITAVVAFFTAGAGLAAVGAALASTEFLVGTALATAAATIATKAILKGDAYGWEEIGVDATVGIVDAMAAKFTAGMGSKLLKMGFLARMAEEGGMFARMAAHGLAQGAEGFVQGLPSALAGNVLNDANYKGGNALLNVVGGSVTQAGMSGLMAGSLGLISGVARPKHMVTPKELAEFKLHPENQNKLFAAYKEKVPGATREQFLKHMDEAVLKGKPDIFFSDTVQRAMKQELLEHMDDAAKMAFKDMPIEVVSASDFKKLTGSEKGQAVTMFRRGKPSLVIKAGADLSVLGEEGIHLLQSREKATKDLVKSLDEKALKNWKKLPLEQKVELYRTKLQVEIDAHERLLTSLESKRGLSIEAGSAQSQIRRTRHSLDQLRSRLGDVNALKPGELPGLAKSGKLDYLKDPPRLFNKEPGIHPAPGVEAHGPAAKDAPGVPEKSPAPHVSEPAPHVGPEAKARAEVEAAEAKAQRKAELEEKAKSAESEAHEKRRVAEEKEKAVAEPQRVADELAAKKQAAKDEAVLARKIRDDLEGELKGKKGKERKPRQADLDAARDQARLKGEAETKAIREFDKADEALKDAKRQARKAATEANKAESVANDARRAVSEPADLEYTDKRPNRRDPAVKELEAKPLSDADALESSFGDRVNLERGDQVRQVGRAWKEGGTTYRIVEHVEGAKVKGEPGRIVEVHEEKFKDGSWRKRSAENKPAGDRAERASRLVTDEKLAPVDVKTLRHGEDLPAGKEWVRFESQSTQGHGFDEMLVHFQGEPPKATIHPVEVKNYQGHVPAEDFTAPGRKLEGNLESFRNQLKKSNLPEPHKRAILDALDQWRIQIDVRLAPGSVVSSGALESLERTANLWRGSDVALGELRARSKKGLPVSDELRNAESSLKKAREDFRRAMNTPHDSVGAKKAAKEAADNLERELQQFSKHGIDVNGPDFEKVKIGKPEHIDPAVMKKAEDPGDYLRKRIDEPAHSVDPPRSPTSSSDSIGGPPASPTVATRASDPVRLGKLADEAIMHSLLSERIRTQLPGGPVLGWGGFDISTSLAWSKRRFKRFELAQLADLRARLTRIPDLDPARFSALTIAEKKAAITRAVDATMKSLGIPRSRRPIVQFQNLPHGSFGWMDWRFNATGGPRLSPASKRGVIVISENLNVGDAVGTAVHEGRHYYQAYQAYMESLGRRSVHPFATKWRANLPGSGGVYHQHGRAYFTQPIERDAESFGRRLIDLLPARWPRS